MEKVSTKTKHSLMVMSLPNTQMNILTRDQLQENYILWDLNQMSNEDLRQFFIDSQNRDLGDLDDDELVEEVKQFAPQLVENITLSDS